MAGLDTRTTCRGDPIVPALGLVPPSLPGLAICLPPRPLLFLAGHSNCARLLTSHSSHILVSFRTLVSHLKSNPIQYLLTACYVQGLMQPTSDDINERKRELLPLKYQSNVGREERLSQAHR